MNPPTNKPRDFWITEYEYDRTYELHCVPPTGPIYYGNVIHVREVLPNAHDESEAVIEKVEKALEFYSKDENYYVSYEGDITEAGTEFSEIGNRARKALAFLKSWREKK